MDWTGFSLSEESVKKEEEYKYSTDNPEYTLSMLPQASGQ